MKKGFTLVEVLVVILIVGILIVITSRSMDIVRYNNNIDSVESDLRVFSLDLNNYNLDYGGVLIEDCEDDSVGDIFDDTSKALVERLSEYLAFGIEKNSMGTGFKYDKINGPDKCRISFNTDIKKDPWGSPYDVFIDALKGTIIVSSRGPDGVTSRPTYSQANFGDDIVVLIQRK